MWMLDNRTPFAAERGFVRDSDGGEVWIVLVQATFELASHGPLRPSARQPPVSIAPRFAGSPAGLVLLEDTPLMPDKPGTEVLVSGSAYAPAGRRVSEMDVGFRIGAMRKVLQLVGDRHWTDGVFGPRLSEPVPFSRMPLCYTRALGGMAGQDLSEGPAPHRYNPIGTGHARRAGDLIGIRAPNIEQPGACAEDWHRQVPPAGFGPIPRNWSPRRELAGTFDAAWEQQRQPLLPEDFDPRFYFSAPSDQCFSRYLMGGEAVLLRALHPDGDLQFDMPALQLLCRTRFGRQSRQHGGALHTVHIDTDARQLRLLWHSRLRCHGQEHLLEGSVVALEAAA